MNITIKGHKFEGPYNYISTLDNKSGVYAVLTSNNILLDVGESADVRNRLENHDRKDCWKRKAGNSPICYAVHYTPNLKQEGRKKIEQAIRTQYNNLCGDR